jgi:hypothetical protein
MGKLSRAYISLNYRVKGSAGRLQAAQPKLKLLGYFRRTAACTNGAFRFDWWYFSSSSRIGGSTRGRMVTNR